MAGEAVSAWFVHVWYVRVPAHSFSPRSRNYLAFSLGHPIQLWSWPCKGMIRDPFQPNPARLHADPDLPAGSSCQHTKPTAWKGRCIILCLGAGQHHPQVLPKRQAGLKVLWYCRKHAVPILEADRVYFTIHPTWKQLNRLWAPAAAFAAGIGQSLHFPHFLWKISFSRIIKFACCKVGRKKY